MAVTVTASNVPTTMSVRKTLTPTIEMMASVLGTAGFESGTFVLSVQERQRKKANIKFQAIREEQNHILVRCKPGGNDTCYLWRLQPENDLLKKITLSDLLDRLNQIHPQQLSIPTATSGKKKEELPKAVPPEKHKATSMQRTTRIPDPIEGSGKTKNEAGCGMIVDKNRPCGKKPVQIIEALNGQKAAVCAEHVNSREWEQLVEQVRIEKHRQARQQREASLQKEVEEPTAEEPVSYTSLKISYPEVQSLVDDEEAVDKSLVAACFVMKKDGSAGREDVTTTIINELGLEEFCGESPTYNTVRSAVRVCIDGLVKHGYVTRFQYRPRKRNRKHAGTEGYMITPHGRERIATIMDELTDEMTHRLWSGPPESDPVIDEPSEEAELHSPDPHPTQIVEDEIVEDDQFAALEAQGVFDKLREKLDEFDRLSEELKENSEMISMAKREAQKPEITIMGLDQKIKELHEQITALEANISDLENERNEAVAKQVSETEPIMEWEQRNEEIKARLIELNEEIKATTQQ